MVAELGSAWKLRGQTGTGRAGESTPQDSGGAEMDSEGKRPGGCEGLLFWGLPAWAVTCLTARSLEGLCAQAGEVPHEVDTRAPVEARAGGTLIHIWGSGGGILAQASL